MLPEPMHPWLVHLPLMLAIALPLVAVIVILQKRDEPNKNWRIVVFLAALLSVSAWVTAQVGEREEEVVEEVVAEEFIHEHEEAAERFVLFSWVLLAVTVVGATKLPVATAGRYAAAFLAVLGAIGAVVVGKSGGELVYKHGAAAAWVEGPAGAEPAADGDTSEGHTDDEDDDPDEEDD